MYHSVLVGSEVSIGSPLCSMTWPHLIVLYIPLSPCLEQIGFTPLFVSAYKGHSEVVALLCQRGANIDALTNVSTGDNTILCFLSEFKNIFVAIYAFHSLLFSCCVAMSPLGWDYCTLYSCPGRPPPGRRVPLLDWGADIEASSEVKDDCNYLTYYFPPCSSCTNTLRYALILFDSVAFLWSVEWPHLIVLYIYVSFSRTGWGHPLDHIRCSWPLRSRGPALSRRSRHRGPNQCKQAILLLVVRWMHLNTA